MSDTEHARLLCRLARDNLVVLQSLEPIRYDDLDPADVTDDFREVIDQIADLLGPISLN